MKTLLNLLVILLSIIFASSSKLKSRTRGKTCVADLNRCKSLSRRKSGGDCYEETDSFTSETKYCFDVL